MDGEKCDAMNGTDQAEEVNPVAELCSRKHSSKRPPLFALQFPDLFVY